jgi:diguanylate cyclase
VNDMSADARLPVPVSAYGPLNGLALRVHELAQIGGCEEARAAADDYERAALVFGDHRTVDLLLQGRSYAHYYLGHRTESMRVAEELLARHRASGNTLGEAKILSDLAELCVLTGRHVDGIRHLARAGLLLEATSRRNERYYSALAGYSLAANTAGLYETAAVAYEQMWRHRQTLGHNPGVLDTNYVEMLLSWGLRLDQLGYGAESTSRLRRVTALAEDSLAGSSSLGIGEYALTASWALALAKLGEIDRAAVLAEKIITPLRAGDMHWQTRVAHLALGVALRARGDLTAARRELLAARQLFGRDRRPEEHMIVQFELATLAAQLHGPDATADLLEAVREQAQQLWQQRLQRLAMLRQARQREELEIERARVEAALLQDPLTGLGNRRHFDQLMLAVDAGALPQPTCLLVIDIDKFKSINDTHSHSAGDAVLREIGAILKANCRMVDIPIRYAGDEFTIFVHADLPAAAELAERVRAAVAATDFAGIAPGTPVSISTGVAALLPGMTATDLFQSADTRLYEAKRGGRDRVAA